MKTVPVYEAKTKFSELLAAVEHGEQVTITRRGRPVARLVSAKEAAEPAQAQRERVADTGKATNLWQRIEPFIPLFDLSNCSASPDNRPAIRALDSTNRLQDLIKNFAVCSPGLRGHRSGRRIVLRATLVAGG